MITKHTFEYGSHKVTLETGRLAKQATSAVYVEMGNTTLLATLVAKMRDKPAGFLPLTVIYQERSYAVGKIPGGYLKREGKPTERETLVSRLVDRAIRPLFAKTFEDEIQIIITLLSLDEKVMPDVPAILAASTVIALAKLPTEGIAGAARLGYDGKTYCLNPSQSDNSLSHLNLVMAGTEHATVMIECAAKELDENNMLEAINFGQQGLQQSIEHIQIFIDKVKLIGYSWKPPAPIEKDLSEQIEPIALPLLQALYLNLPTVQDVISIALEKIKSQTLTELNIEEPDDARIPYVDQLLQQLNKRVVRCYLLTHQQRLDGRKFDEIRAIEIMVGLLPRVHGSALFTRGGTQALVTATLGQERDAQLVEEDGQVKRKTFLLHYNFPPYCVGETGPLLGPKRREIGHGHLAKRALQPVLPSKEDFPYTLRLVSEIMEANGSSSMATVCGSSLALMDAGIPITSPVAGIAMGLITENDEAIILSDINEAEDHLGDMDFKVAGTKQGITALQMDVKALQITPALLKNALEQARQGRLYLLDVMQSALPTSREKISPYAPCIIKLSVPVDQIRELIGKGGATIRALSETTTTEINVDDKGTVQIVAMNAQDAEKAKRRIEAITREIAVGEIIQGSVAKTADFGVFITLKPGKDGLVHISEVSDEKISSVHKEFTEGEIVTVKVLHIDERGRIRLTMKGIEEIT